MAIRTMPAYFAWVAGTLACMATPAVRAQTYAIDWWTVDGGGGTISGAQFILSFTVGQPDAGAAVGGQYALTSGFWAIASTAVQPTPLPTRTPTVTPTPSPIGTSVPAPENGSGHVGGWLVIFATLAMVTLRRTDETSRKTRSDREE